MIEWRFTTQDVARIRFVFSPLWETVLSLIVLRAPARHALHLPWIQSARPRVATLDLTELFDLVPVRGIVADFLTPPPDSPLPDLDSELDDVRRIPADRVIADLEEVPGIPAATVERITADPHGALLRIADTLHVYWELALADHWPRIRALLEADVLWRSRRLAAGGARELFDGLHESVTWHGDHLTAADRWHHCGALTGEGLLLAPSAMVWPGVRKQVHPYQPMIAYPVRGIATLWESSLPPTSAELGSLIGHTRAKLLNALIEPHTTTGLARRLTVTAGAVSQHLTVLRANGLVARTRVGAVVLYHRTIRGDSLVAADCASPSRSGPGGHEDRHPERRLLAPAVYLVVGATPGDDRTGGGGRIVDHPTFAAGRMTLSVSPREAASAAGWSARRNRRSTGIRRRRSRRTSRAIFPA